MIFSAKAYMKDRIGADVQEKILYANQALRERGLTDQQVLYTLALIDHESVGSWSETIVGDGGCSIGIAQWNKCVGNIAPATYEEQVQLIADEMASKFAEFDDLTALGKHNAPSWDYNEKYINKVLESAKNFI
jgi:hypothetical protein